MSQTIALAVVSDVHCGSTLAAAPPEGVRLDDGGKYVPSKVQSWIWQCWEEYWAWIDGERRGAEAELWTVYNGDAYEGDHHGTSQIISKNPEAQGYVSDRTFGVPLGLRPARQFVVRGTVAHVGEGGCSEEALAKKLQAEKDEEAGTWSWWHLRLEVNGLLIDCQHHGRAGYRPWTESSAASLLAANIWYEHARRGERSPDLAFRAHVHKFADSGTMQPTRLIVTPSWQAKTAHTHKVAPESIADIGGVLLLVKPDGTYDLKTKLFPHRLPSVWTPPLKTTSSKRSASRSKNPRTPRTG